MAAEAPVAMAAVSMAAAATVEGLWVEGPMGAAGLMEADALAAANRVVEHSEAELKAAVAMAATMAVTWEPQGQRRHSRNLRC